MKEPIDELLELIDKVKSSDNLVIVEGKEDKAALKRLGVTNVIQLNKRPLYKVVEEVVRKEKETIILTDLDKKGKELYRKLNHPLQQFGIRIDNKLRHFLFKNTKLRQIEGLDSYIRKKVDLNTN
ncbi:MAG: toprim domain-containing protein [Nanoarchaeota archaeon]|nr:toprim domain-containing protein [Nanoarchaeota archaeon]